ncbi:MAG: cytochrome c biogenesis protein CcsA [Ignavibacteriaceae bacterium]|nr:cytochrome c biogenesis protein CcsA [Ignavibacterium sp.]MCC6253702.1 cytochrome c biogenesis protein CcsA [Ignavibacteriaceae bacterium]HRN25417.1 cytochrome c-type biogenesis CcmF C-terminal domain-containing protein [Ignavibacteriaceae bacterium]HRQ53182.1 cytochrome c-type biogenesis CcmF C-terminal domain-containing protein [Ignavibacteriaceae bacterium]
MIGSIFLSLALVFSIIAMVMYYLSFKGYKNTLNIARYSYHGMAIFVIAASTFLWYAILTHQYQYKYIFSYSQNSLSTGLLFSSFWGGQEGSFMLWLLLTSIIGIILQSYSSKRGDLEPRVMAIFALATSFLLVMVSPWFKNPFEYIWMTPIFIDVKNINAQFLNLPFIQNFIFTDQQSNTTFVQMSSQLHTLLAQAGVQVNQFIADGKGLNPQLLNYWMQIHPPMLFVGFSMATVPFAFAMAALMKNDYREWVNQSLPWVLAGTGILGLGIMMGGYWAYEMLGWGGYWAWDPVENSSLIPWLIGVASIHTMLVQKRSLKTTSGIGRYAKTNLILSILTYILVLYSTFLTRSGVLGDASVHSFVDPGQLVYLFLVVFIGTFILLGFGSIALRWKHLEDKTVYDETVLSRELSLFTAAIILVASAIIVLVGTSAPLFGHAVDTFFYDEMHLPIAIIIGLLNGLSLLIKWKSTNTKDLIKESMLYVIASVVLTVLIVVFGGVHKTMMIILTFSAVFAIVVNGEIAFKIIKGNLKNLGGYIAHIGISLFILGIVGSAAYSDHKNVELVKDKPTTAFGYEMTFTGYTPIENNTKYAFNINMKKGDKTYTVSPVMYISEYNNSLMREPAILNLFSKDIYLAPLGFDEGTNQSTGGGEIVQLEKGKVTEYKNSKISFDKFDISSETMADMQAGKDFQMGANLTIETNGKKEEFELFRKSVSGEVQFTDYISENAGLKIKLTNLTAEMIEVSIASLNENQQHVVEQKQEVLSVTASIKPYISLVWIGIIVMVLGFFVAVARRLKESLL